MYLRNRHSRAKKKNKWLTFFQNDCIIVTSQLGVINVRSNETRETKETRLVRQDF